jgi:hypothetical protein
VKIIDEINAILSKYGEAPEYGESCETSYTKLLNCVRAMEDRIANKTKTVSINHIMQALYVVGGYTLDEAHDLGVLVWNKLD